MSDKIQVIYHVYETTTCSYCDCGFKKDDVIDIEYDGDVVHQSCVLKEEEERIQRGEAKRCEACDFLIVNPKNGSFDKHLHDGKYMHPHCAKTD